MSDDLDRRLAATLRAHAGSDVDPAAIVQQARSRGQRLRRRRRALTALGAAAGCAVLAAAGLAIPGLSGQATRPTAAILPPAAPDQPGAARRPALVGTDPTVLHFTADTLVAGADYVTWSAGRDTESVEFHGPGGAGRFVLARSATTLDAVGQTLASAGSPRQPTPVSVGGRPGTAWSDPSPSGGPDLWFVRWEPVDGLWARLDSYAPGRDEAVGAAGRVRFDGARRCVLPFRLQSLPAGARVLECSVNLGTAGRGAFAEGSLVVGDGSGRWLTLRAQRTQGGERPGGQLRAGPYRVRRQGSDVLQMFVEPCSVEVFLNGRGQGYAEPDGLLVLGGYRPVGEIDDTETW